MIEPRISKTACRRDALHPAIHALIGYGGAINTDPSGCHRLRVTGTHGSVFVSGDGA